MNTPRSFFFVCAGLLVLLPPHHAAAAWPTDPLANVPLCTATGDQYYPTIASDGAGGAIVTWEDKRSYNSTRDIYAQRISADGTVQWTANGVALCAADGQQWSPTIVSDGAGGAIVTWFDQRSGNYDIYAQRISADGTVQWTANGVALCTTANDQKSPTITSDGAGGAIVTWFDHRSSSFDIYAQRISAGGTVQWAANGVALCAATGDQGIPTIVSDGAGGAIVTWQDYRISANADIYAQRISAGGTVQWAANGVALCTATGNQDYPTITSDGAGAAIVTWRDKRNGAANVDIYAQRISAGGTPQWTADGVALCTATGWQEYPTIVSDGAGGAIVTWQDYRSGNYDIYAQRSSAGGTVQWPPNGVALCTAGGEQAPPIIASDGVGGAIVTWQDDRGSSFDIYAQRISAGGTVQWTADGVVLCTATGNQYYPTIASDGAGGAIVTWQDLRSSNQDIYAQRVQANGQLGGTVDVSGEASLAFALDPVRPNPVLGGTLTVRFTLASGTAASLELLDVAGRRIITREVGSLGAGRHTLDLGEGRRLAPGLYLVCLRQGTNTRVTRVAVLK